MPDEAKNNEEKALSNEESKAQFMKVASETVQGLAPSVAPIPVLTGRKRIMTNYLSASQVRANMFGYEILNENNIIDAVNLALEVHRENAQNIHYLVQYYKGVQNIFNRTKDIRPDVDNRVVINYANTFTRDIIGYTFGKPMQYVARRTDDKEDEENNSIKDEVRLLNDYAELADKPSSDQDKATDCSIFGIAHRGVFPRKTENDDESPYYYLNLDSENTFVAHNSQLGGEDAFACTYIESYEGMRIAYTLYTVYTKDQIYLFKSPFRNSYMIEPSDLVEGYPLPNPLGMIPIVECENNQFRMGHWETAITLMDAVNKVASDSVNDVEQFVNSILVAINAEFTEKQMKEVKENKYAEIKSPQGLNADLKYISEQLDGASVEQLRQYLEDCLRAVVGIPDRKTRGGGGGDTGDAVKLRDGWADMEVVARTTETFNKKSEKKELRLILKILRDLKKIKKTSMINVDIKYPRNKTDNLNSKVTAYASLHGTQTMAPEDALDIVDITTDIAEVVARGEGYWKKKKEENFEEQQRQLQLQKKMQGAEGVTQEGGNVNVRSSATIKSAGTGTSTKRTNSNTASKSAGSNKSANDS